MIVPAMNSRELLREFLNDLQIVDRKANYLCESLRRPAVKSKQKHILKVFDYKSKQYNNWIIVVDYLVKNPCYCTVVWYIDEYGLNGLAGDSSLNSLTHITPHFLERYNERYLHKESISKIELLKHFICNNHLEVIVSVPGGDSNSNRIFGRFNEGIGLGYVEPMSDTGKEIRHFKTFISKEMIRESQEEIYNYSSKEYDEYWEEISKSTRRRA